MTSPRHIVGMDFGTTNSGMAVFDGQTVRVLPLDEANRNPRVARTAVYVTNDQQVHIGREAINTYLDQNMGRPTRMERVWVGEIEVRAEDMYYVDDVYVYTDVLSPGRLFLSIKSGLRETDYHGTVVGQFYYALEDLIALYLTVTKKRAEQLLGHELREVVLGRPVRFAFQPEQDRLAQGRLLDAAFRAGYEKVYLQYEPIAAAYHYAQERDETHNILVFDFGGGTLDITVMKLGDGRREILATGGIPIAGDIFDQKTVRAKLPKHFGEGSTYTTRHKAMPVPSWIYDIFSDWQRILELQTTENREMLAEIAEKAHRPRELEALISLVANNYALQMFDAVEQAKRRLSDDMGTIIKFDGPKFNIRQLITRNEFEAIIHEEVLAIDQHVDEMVEKAGLTHSEVDIVIRTGGSAEIPIFRHMLEDKFGRDTVREVDTFSSVTSGLGILAHGIAQGEVELQGYTPADLPEHQLDSQTNVPHINLELLQKRISLKEEEEIAQAEGGARLVVLANGNQMESFKWGEEIVNCQLSMVNGQWGDAVVADYDEPLLLVTSTYRFILLTPRQLDELDELAMGIGDLYHFKFQEEVCALGRWSAIREHKWLTLVTSRGYARGYRLRALLDLIESPVPYQFDDGLPGVPVALFGAEDSDQFVVYNDDGRAQRFPMSNGRLRVRGVQALNWKEGERVMGAFKVDARGAAEDELLLVTREGYGRRIEASALPLGRKGNERPAMLSSRRPVQVVGVLGERPLLVTSQGIRPVDVARLPEFEERTKTYAVGRLADDEMVLMVV